MLVQLLLTAEGFPSLAFLYQHGRDPLFCSKLNVKKAGAGLENVVKMGPDVPFFSFLAFG